MSALACHMPFAAHAPGSINAAKQRLTPPGLHLDACAPRLAPLPCCYATGARVLHLIWHAMSRWKALGAARTTSMHKGTPDSDGHACVHIRDEVRKRPSIPTPACPPPCSVRPGIAACTNLLQYNLQHPSPIQPAASAWHLSRHFRCNIQPTGIGNGASGTHALVHAIDRCIIVRPD